MLSFFYLRLLLLLAIAIAILSLLFGCTTYEVVETAPPPKQYVRSAPDPAALAMLKCDALGLREGHPAHRLCVMREIDRLKVSPPLFSNLPKAAPIQILPYPYPPLAPSVPCIGCAYPSIK